MHASVNVVVTGGTGYIGSHTVVELLLQGYHVIIIDNLSNSSIKVLERIKMLTNGKTPDFHRVDLLDKEGLGRVFSSYDSISAVIHFAGLKAVGESTKIPLAYYQNNITGSLNLLEVMNEFNVPSIIYSSSATVYGDPQILPIPENCPTGPTSPYGKTKLFVEQIIEDLCRSNSNFQGIILRYFNPVGAHPSGILGEDPKGIPNNLMPFVASVAIGRFPLVNVYGTDYETRDGTGVRDYIHVQDLALGHVAALEKFKQKEHFPTPNYLVYNLGTGVGYSVLEMIAAFSMTIGKEIPYRLTNRRPGDVATLLADPTKANEELQWKANYTLASMTTDLWRWQSNNPDGFDTENNKFISRTKQQQQSNFAQGQSINFESE